MKKFFIGTAAVLALSLSAFALAACDSNDKGGDHKHTLVKHEAVEKTCEDAGSKLYWECSDCGKLYLDEKATNETTLDGTVIAAGHTEVLLPGKAATCTEKGLTEGSKCSACGETIVEQQEIAIDPTAHNYKEVEHDEDGHWFKCACGAKTEPEAHKGGTATTEKKAECEVCGEEYGDYGTMPPQDPPQENPPTEDLVYNGTATKFTANLDSVTLTGGGNKQDGGEGGKFIGEVYEGVTITFSFKSEAACTAELFLAAAGRQEYWTGPIEGAFSVYVNGSEEALKIIDVGTGDWLNFQEIFIGRVDLVEGDNTVVFVAGEDTNGHVNVDYLLVAPLPDSTYAGEEKTFGSDLAELEDCELQENGAGQGGYVVGEIDEGSKITYTIDSSVAGVVTLSVSVARPQAMEGAFEVTLNGTSLGTFDIEAGSFKEIALGEVTLEEGKNTIEIVASAKFQFNYLKLVPFKSFDGTEEMIIGAGKATVQGGCDVQTNGMGYDGHIVGGISGGGNSVVSFTVNADVATTASLYASVAGGTFDGINWESPATEGSFEVWVNGSLVGSFDFKTNGWLDFTEFLACTTISLNAGENTIELHATAGNANLNYIKLAPEA